MYLSGQFLIRAFFGFEKSFEMYFIENIRKNLRNIIFRLGDSFMTLKSNKCTLCSNKKDKSSISCIK